MESECVTRKKPPKLEEMTKEQIRNTIVRKRETNARAQRVVESLLDPGVSEQSFLRCLPHINQSHLDDVVEERSITHACGYPPCRNQLTTHDIPKQQYKISTKTNKVYDITMRKNFCSNRCYKATLYVKNQMLTSPLWFRDSVEIPTFHLMPIKTVPSMGQEIDLSLTEKIKVKNDDFTTIREFASASFNELDNDVQSHSPTSEQDLELSSNSKPSNCYGTDNLKNTPDKSVENEKTIHLNPAEPLEQFIEKTNVTKKSQNSSMEPISYSKSAEKQIPKNKKNSFNIIGEVVERPERKIDPIIASAVMENRKNSKPIVKKTTRQKKDDTIQNIVIHVEKCIAEWFTLDSMILLFGEARVKEMVAHKGDSIKEYLNNMASGLLYSSASYDQYQQLCRKLNMLELEDHRYDGNLNSKETKPLPDYSILKAEGTRIELKVRAFLSGECDIPEPSTAAEQPSAEEDPSNFTQLALVDRKAQNALRRTILLTNLNKVLNDLQRSLGIQGVSITSDVRLLVNSFKLKATNIMFKPIQWTLIGVVALKLLSLRDVRIRRALETPTADRNLQLLLLSYKQDGGYLDRLVLWLTDVDRLLNTNDTQLTLA